VEDLKINWSKEELLDIIAEAEILGKTDFAGKCKICTEMNPVIIRYRFDVGIVTCCPQCALDHQEVKEYEEEQRQLAQAEARRKWQAQWGSLGSTVIFPVLKKK
jgi:hypothetical protein